MNALTKRSVSIVLRKNVTSTSQAGQIRQYSDHDVKPRRWARWQDVPDDWVLPSKRMPNNPIYTTEEWKKMKKKQIFYQQNDGLPVWLKRGYPYNYLYWVAAVLFVYSGYNAFAGLLDGHIFPKKNN